MIISEEKLVAIASAIHEKFATTYQDTRFFHKRKGKIIKVEGKPPRKLFATMKPSARDH